MIKSFSDLDVYQLSYHLAIDIFKISKDFPSSEKYSLTSQIVLSSRSISANIAEGFGRKTYPTELKKVSRLLNWLFRRNQGLAKLCERLRIYHN